MSAADTTFTAALKEYYKGVVLEQLLYNDHPFLKILEKGQYDDWAGKYLSQPVNYAPRGGVSGDFATAQAQGIANTSNYKVFQIPSFSVYGNTLLAGQAIRASANQEGAFAPLIKQAMDEMMANMGQSLTNYLFRSGGGEIGQIGAISGATITLQNPADALNIDVGAQLDSGASLTASAKARGSSGNPLTVTAVDPSTGVLTFGYNVTDATNGIPTAAVGDFLFKAGDHTLNGVTYAQQVPAGLEGWCPSVANRPVVGGGDSFYGVDRSVSGKLVGTSIDASNGQVPVRELLVKAVNKAANIGGKPTFFVMNQDYYTQLANSMLSKQVISLDTGVPGVGVEEGIKIEGTRTNAVAICDPQCPANRIFGFNPDALKLLFMGDWTTPWDDDGNTMLRHPSKDAIEVRWNLYCNLVVSRPNDLVNLQVPVVS